MSPLEHPVGWALVIGAVTAPVWLPVVFVVQDWTRTVRRNRRLAAERAAQRDRLAGAIGRLEQRGYLR